MEAMFWLARTSATADDLKLTWILLCKLRWLLENWHYIVWINWQYCSFEGDCQLTAALNPGTNRFLSSYALLPLARQYDANIDDLSVELEQIRRMIRKKRSRRIND